MFLDPHLIYPPETSLGLVKPECFYLATQLAMNQLSIRKFLCKIPMDGLSPNLLIVKSTFLMVKIHMFHGSTPIFLASNLHSWWLKDVNSPCFIIAPSSPLGGRMHSGTIRRRASNDSPWKRDDDFWGVYGGYITEVRSFAMDLWWLIGGLWPFMGFISCYIYI